MNLLNNIPMKTTAPLLNPLKRDLVSPTLEELEYDGACMNATKAILDLQLHRLTGLEQDKITDEFKEIIGHIKEYLEILTNPDRLVEVVTEELEEIKENFGDERRTVIMNRQRHLTMKDLIIEEDVVVTL